MDKGWSTAAIRPEDRVMKLDKTKFNVEFEAHCPYNAGKSKATPHDDVAEGRILRIDREACVPPPAKRLLSFGANSGLGGLDEAEIHGG